MGVASSNYDPRILEGRWAIITGGASKLGVGFGAARICRCLNLNVLLIDVRPDLEEVAKALELDVPNTHAVVEAVHLDVGDDVAWDTLVRERFADSRRNIAFLFLNAGVHTGKAVHEATASEWWQLIKINIMGVANGLRSFTELMVHQQLPSVIVATSSIAGLTPSLTGPYSATKYAVRNMMEQFYAEMKRHPVGSNKVFVHLLCPEFYVSDLANTSRMLGTRSPEIDAAIRAFSKRMKNNKDTKTGKSGNLRSAPPVQSMTNNETAEMLFEHIQNGEFYIITSPSRGNTGREHVARAFKAIQEHQPPYTIVGAAWPRKWQLRSDL